MPKVNKPRRAKTHRPKELKTEKKKVDTVIEDKPVDLVEKWEPKKPDQAQQEPKKENPIQDDSKKDEPTNKEPESGPSEPLPATKKPDPKKIEALNRTNSLYTNHIA